MGREAHDFAWSTRAHDATGMVLPNKSISIEVIALNYSPEATGIGPFAADIANGFKENGHRVNVVTGHPHYPQWRPLSDYAAHDVSSASNGIAITRKRHYIPRRASFVQRSIMEIGFGIRVATARRKDVDVVFCISPPLLAVLLIQLRQQLRRRRTPLVIWVQDLYGLGVAETKGSGTFAARVASALEALAFRTATALAVIHDRFRAHIVDRLGVNAESVRVFRNWSRQEPIPAAERAEALRILGWEQLADHVLVLHAGNMGTKQGLENVVEAARLADTTEDKVTFILVGDGNQRARLERMAEGVSSIRFVDVLEADKFGYALRAADMLLVNQIPGISEMCVPSKVLSYFSAGRPVIAAVDPDGITADDIRHSEAGVVIPAGEPARLLKEVVALTRDGHAMQHMGQAGRDFIETNFDRDATIKAIADWLVDLVTPRGPLP